MTGKIAYRYQSASYLNGHPLAFLGRVNRPMVVLDGHNPTNINEFPLWNTYWSPDLFKLSSLQRGLEH